LETRGFCIPKDSPQEVEDLFALRTVLEGYALRLICDRITDDEIGALEKMIDQAENALGLGKIDEVFHWNTLFHDTLHGMIEDKRRFHSFIVNMRKYVLRYRKSTLQHLGAGKRALNGHRQIILSLKLRDPELCERVMRHHVREAEEDALSAGREGT
jgi:DNA-binding GntR family transcriptional regulator